ncbi:MAG: glycosyltransferase family 4 protein [Acidimicrobiales bacterium]
MRIGLICPYSLTVPGGVQGQVLSLGRALRDLGHDALVLGPCDGPPPETGVIPLGNSIPTAANGSVAPIAPDPACALRTIRAVWDEDFDVPHVHEPIVPGPCQTTLLLASAPIVGTFHSSGGSHAYYAPGVKWLAGRMTRRVVVSRQAEITAKQRLGGSYTTLFNGIELERFAKATPTEFADQTIVFVGRHEPRKGLEVLLKAFSRLEGSARLAIAGQGPQTAELQRRWGLYPRIDWLGHVNDGELVSLIKGADVLCVPSLHGESFGVVLLEGMAASTAVVASDIDGYRNVATDGLDALLVEPGDAAALASGLQSVLDDSVLSERLVEAGLVRAEKFSMTRLAEEYLKIYESLQ